MPIDTAEARAALLALCDAATEGPWKFPEGAKFITPNLRPTSKDRVVVMDPQDFALIAAARTELPAALRRIDALEAALVDILDYRGGADSALDDEYVVGRARAALAASKGGV